MCVGVDISIHVCYPQGDGLNTSLSRLSYLVLYTVLQLSGCPVVPYFVQYQVPCVLGAHDECYMNYVYLCISSPYINRNMNNTPLPKCQSSGTTATKGFAVRIENDYMNVRGAFLFFSFNNGIRFPYKSSSYSVYIYDTSIQSVDAAFRRAEMRRKISHPPSCIRGLLTL